MKMEREKCLQQKLQLEKEKGEAYRLVNNTVIGHLCTIIITVVLYEFLVERSGEGIGNKPQKTGTSPSRGDSPHEDHTR